jgi:hypothetical protein
VFDVQTGKVVGGQHCIKVEKFFLEFYSLIDKQFFVEVERDDVRLLGVRCHQEQGRRVRHARHCLPRLQQQKHQYDQEEWCQNRQRRMSSAVRQDLHDRPSAQETRQEEKNQGDSITILS